MFGRKKKEEPKNKAETTQDAFSSYATKLRNAAGKYTASDDLVKALQGFVFLDPKKITIPYETAVQEAREFEEKGNMLRASVAHRTAAGLALYKGDVAALRRHLEEYERVGQRTEFRPIKENAETVVKIGQEFYGNLDEKKEVSEHGQSGD